jgi:hypothetical protein
VNNNGEISWGWHLQRSKKACEDQASQAQIWWATPPALKINAI